MNKNHHNMLNVVVWAVVACFCTSAFGGTMSSDRYYTWGISSDDLNIPEGSIITEAVLTIQGITNWDNNLYMHIVDNPPLDFVANVDDGSGDFFQDFDGLLSGYSYELVDGDLVITFSQINDENSWVWDIFDSPFNFQLADSSVVSYSSSLLELIDYAGNSTPFGIGFDPDGNSYDFQAMTLDLTVESYEGQAVRSDLTFTTTGYSGLVACWTLDESANNTIVADSSGYDKHGTTPSPTSTLNMPGQVGDCFDLGGSDYVIVPDHDDFSFGDGSSDSAFSLCAWVYVTDGETQRFLTKWDLNNELEWEFRFTSAETLRIGLYDESASAQRGLTSNAALSVGWHHVAATYDGRGGGSADGGLTLYVDGSPIAASPVSSGTYVAMENLGADVVIGAGLATDAAITIFEDKVDEVKIFNKALSPGEIEELYNERGSISNQAPVLASIGNKSVDENSSLTFGINATDSDGDTLTYSAFDLPSGATFNSQTGIFSWTPSGAQIGQYSMTFTVTDDGDGNLTDSETITITVNTAGGLVGLVGHWTLNEAASGNTVVDSSGYDKHGTTSSPTSTLNVPGQVGDCFDLGGSDYVIVPDHDDFSFGDGSSDSAFSLCAWVYVTDGETQRFLTKWDLNNELEWEFRFTSAETLRIGLYDESASAQRGLTSNAALSVGWHHVAATYDGRGGGSADGGLTLYVDGSPIAASPVSSGTYVAMENLGADVVIGAGLATDAAITIFEDKVDEVKIFNKALSPGEIEELYNE